MGIMSMIDVLLGKNLEEVLEEIYLCNDVKLALLGRQENLFYYIYNLIYNYERGQWDKVKYYCEKVNINKYELTKIYFEAIQWVNMIICI